MSYRKISILLFAMIGLLLGSKLGMHLLAPSSPAISNTVKLETPAQAKVFMTTDTLPKTVELGVEESFTMLENYIFPLAEAATAQASPEKSRFALEDETLTGLREYKSKLDQRTKQLDQREKSIQDAENQVKQRITELEQLEASIQQRLNDESKIKSKKIKRLASVYEGMKPESAAPVIARMELPTVVKIFLLMDEKRVGKILSFLPPEKAVLISQALTRQISTVK